MVFGSHGPTRTVRDVAVVIPARQESASVGEVIRGVLRHAGPRVAHVIVVDDGSTDGTGDVASAAGAGLVVRHSESQGKGAALRSGFKAALALGAGWVVTLDADGQHDPSEIIRLVSEARRRHLDLLVGWRRDRLRLSPWLNLVTNWAMSWIVASVSGGCLRDSQCGFRVHSADLLRAVHLQRTGFDLETEIILKARRLGARIGQSPVRTIYAHDRRSWIRPAGDALRFFGLILGA